MQVVSRESDVLEQETDGSHLAEDPTPGVHIHMSYFFFLVELNITVFANHGFLS